jgi:hypothetical protein
MKKTIVLISLFILIASTMGVIAAEEEEKKTKRATRESRKREKKDKVLISGEWAFTEDWSELKKGLRRGTYTVQKSNQQIILTNVRTGLVFRGKLTGRNFQSEATGAMDNYTMKGLFVSDRKATYTMTTRGGAIVLGSMKR